MTNFVYDLKSEFNDLQTNMDKIIVALTELRLEMHSSSRELEQLFIMCMNKKSVETNIEVNRIDLSSENNEMESYSGTPTTTNYECEEIINVDISEHEDIDQQSDLEIVNDMEVDWDEDIVFDHSTIESKAIVTEQQLTEVKCIFFHSKYSSESLVSTTQQEVNAMKHVATDVEVFSTNVRKVENELNSCMQFEEELLRKIWDPGLDTMLL